ncbi:MAG: protein translocase subunit SecD, partial [Clostridia bacterium]|nr:protein translocase subunit SecD [Clostridia bacterium]
VWLEGEGDIESAYVAQDTTNGGYLVILNFSARGSAKFAEATKQVSGMEDNALYIYLGDTVVSQPTVNQQINSASAQIEGYETYEDALSIASVIDSGKLPIEYTVSESRSISSKLGESALSNSALMGAIGLLLVFILMIVRYRGLGIASSVALMIYVLLYIVFLAIIPNVQLTLPGIAGILLSIGMAVDACVIIFERIREEYRMGKTVEAAINHGFKRAIITVFDSNITTIFAAIVLWILCPGTIKGFAITLLIGIVLSLIVMIFVTKWLVKLFMPFANDEEKFLNLSREGGND